MTSFEAYCLYLAITRHFSDKGKYDYFKYNGRVKANFESFERKSPVEQSRFTKISAMGDPEGYIAGNCIFGSSKYIVNFNKENLLTFDKYRKNGLVFFIEELAHLRDDMTSNFVVNEFNSVPHVLRLYWEKKISLFTLCILNKIFKLSDRWVNTPNYIAFKKMAEEMIKASPWFDVKPEKYIQAVKDRFGK